MAFLNLSLLLFVFCFAQSLPAPPVPDLPADYGTLLTNQGNIYEINQASDLDLFEGDILKTPKARNAIIGAQYRWPSIIPYYLDDNLEINAKGVILKAFERYRMKSCIEFKPWSGEKNYIYVFKGSGCYSYVGNQQIGKQQLSIGTGCDTVEIVQHEVLHALGFFHEQSRSDRDDYITVIWENIQSGKELNFNSYDDSTASFLGVAYDYTSVMHYSSTSFSTGNATIVPKNPLFNNIIGKQMDLSAKDTLKLNRLYNCTTSITFMDSCDFESDEVCAMLQRSDDNSDWLRVTKTPGGPSADHSYMENSRGYFMHFNTSSGKSGDEAVLESRLFYPKRGYQCLEFFYYHSGNESDQLNIWIKQYPPGNPNGTMALIESIRGKPETFWQLHHSSINATNTFRFVFQGIKSNGSSTGGISIDDINLSETECPQNIWQIRNFTQDLTKNVLYSPPYYSREGYAFQIALWSYASQYSSYNLAAYLYLISGANDDKLQWPCLWKQVTVEFLDQNPDVQQRTSNMKSITTDDTLQSNMRYVWDNPAVPVWKRTFANGTKYNATGGRGFLLFSSQEWLYRRDFLKGGNAFVLISMEDISSLKTLHPLTSSTTTRPPSSSSSTTTTRPPSSSSSTSTNQSIFKPSYKTNNQSSSTDTSLSSISTIISSTNLSSTSDVCNNYICYNGGTCFIEDQNAVCRCSTSGNIWFEGERCEQIFVNRGNVWTTPLSTTLFMAVVIALTADQ